jgi:hypothetical protein
MIGRHRILTTELRQRLDKLLVIAACFQHQKLAIGFTFFFEVAIDGNLTVAQYQNLVAAFFDVD